MFYLSLFSWWKKTDLKSNIFPTAKRLLKRSQRVDLALCHSKATHEFFQWWLGKRGGNIWVSFFFGIGRLSKKNGNTIPPHNQSRTFRIYIFLLAAKTSGGCPLPKRIQNSGNNQKRKAFERSNRRYSESNVQVQDLKTRGKKIEYPINIWIFK